MWKCSVAMYAELSRDMSRPTQSLVTYSGAQVCLGQLKVYSQEFSEVYSTIMGLCDVISIIYALS